MMAQASLLAFWTFGSAGMLLWGFAASIPLVLHLWSRRRFQETTWGAMEFLLAALRKNARRMRIEQFLLLAIRMAAIGLFALALSDPILSWRPGESAGASRSQTLHLFVINTSY